MTAAEAVAAATEARRAVDYLRWRAALAHQCAAIDTWADADRAVVRARWAAARAEHEALQAVLAEQVTA